MWPTLVLSLALPFVLPYLIRFVYGKIYPAPSAPAQGQGGLVWPPPPPPQVESTTASLARHGRLLTGSLGVSYYFLSAFRRPANIFLEVAAPNNVLQAYFPVLRAPVDVRTPTEKLAKEWGKTLTREPRDDEMLLLTRLQSLDGRRLYALFGPGPLLDCLWCQSAPDKVLVDYTIYSVPGIALAYVTALVVVGILTSGRRHRWRKTAGYALFVLAAAEVVVRTKRAIDPSSNFVMIDSICHAARNLGFALVVLAIFILPPGKPGGERTALQAIEPVLAEVANKLGRVGEGVSLLNVEQFAIMLPKGQRSRVNAFWARTEEDFNAATRDLDVRKEMDNPSLRDEIDQVMDRSFALRAAQVRPAPAPQSAANGKSASNGIVKS